MSRSPRQSLQVAILGLASLGLPSLQATCNGQASAGGAPSTASQAAPTQMLNLDFRGGKATEYLGVMYATGRGVAEDDREAVKWYRQAADLGNAPAMYLLGLMYRNGEGVVQDDIEAYAWLSVAAAFGDKDAGELRDVVAKRLSFDARITAQSRAKAIMERVDKAMKK